MNERRKRLIDIFQDTIKQVNEDQNLIDSCSESRKSTLFVPADKYFDISSFKNKDGLVRVNENKTFQDVFMLHKQYPNKKICALNFASATNPGGMVKQGSSAQEECLCRSSTLYFSLDIRYLHTKYYEPHKYKKDPLYTDALIYIPKIKIIKTDDDFPVRLPKKEYVDVDIITCAAPNLRRIEISDEELYNLHLSRARHILNVAVSQGVDIIVLGAFGCGAFKNNPWVVAKAFKEVLKEYAKYFEIVDFAVYHREFEDENFKAFKETI